MQMVMVMVMLLLMMIMMMLLLLLGVAAAVVISHQFSTSLPRAEVIEGGGTCLKERNVRLLTLSPTTAAGLTDCT